MAGPGTLDSFIISRRPQPDPVFTSQEIRDRGSTFVANVYHATSPEEAKARINHLKYILHGPKPATHEIAAWRCMVLKSGHTGLEGPDDFELRSGSTDDGESWAGSKVLKVLENQAIIDAVVIVSRWYGGTMLGPARFSHIERCALEVCQAFKRSEELRENIATLQTLDVLLDQLRSDLSQLTHPDSSTPPDLQSTRKQPNYTDLDVPKTKRLIRARENAVKSVKSLISKHKEVHPEKETLHNAM